MAAQALSQPTSFVYVIGPDTGPCKVGVANDVDVRCRQIQIDRPEKITVLYRLAVPKDRRFDVEKHAHSILAANRTRGEWFDVDHQAAIEAVKTAANDVAEGQLIPGDTKNDRSTPATPRRRRKRNDGLATLTRATGLTDRQKIAALIYRRVFDTAAHEAAMIERGGMVGQPPKRVALGLLGKMHDAVSAAVTPRAVTLLIEVMGKGVTMSDITGGATQRHRQREEVGQALDVVASLLTAPDM